MNIQAVLNAVRKEQAEGRQWQRWCIGIKVVFSKLLCKPLGYSSGLELTKCSIGVDFRTENPFAADDACVRRTWNLLAGIVAIEENMSMSLDNCSRKNNQLRQSILSWIKIKLIIRARAY